MTTPESPFDEEDAPLLPDLRPAHMRTHSYSSLPFYQTRSRRVFISIAYLIIFILSFGGYLMAVPSVRLYEDIVCHHYYNGLQGESHIGLGEKIDEDLCKVDEVQGELNILYGALHFLGALPRMFSHVKCWGKG